MTKIQLITFKGCQSTIDFRNQLEDLIDKENLNVEIEMIIIPSIRNAKEIGLFGSPTILIDGGEYQQERQGPPGFYWRAYSTAEGFRPYPLRDEILSVIQGKPEKSYKIEKISVGKLPTLVTANWCPFTITAKKFWMEATQTVGLPLRVLDAESDEGKSFIGTVNVAGVPCLIVSPERLFYGLNLSLDKAKSFLTTKA